VIAALLGTSQYLHPFGLSLSKASRIAFSSTALRQAQGERVAGKGTKRGWGQTDTHARSA
jgi:hypothetical protein